MTYSLDFRQKVLAIREQEGLTLAEAAVSFGIGVATVTRWCKRLEPQQRTRTKPATKLDMEVLAQDVKNNPDAYQYERAARLGVSQRAIGNALKCLNVSYKKNTVTSESGRHLFQDKIKAYQADNQPIVYLDYIHVKVCDARTVRTKAVYLALGSNLSAWSLDCPDRKR